MIEGRATGIGHQAEDGRCLYAISYFDQKLTRPTPKHPYGKLMPQPGLKHHYLHAFSAKEAEAYFRAAYRPNSYAICAVGLALGTLVHDDNGDDRSIDASVA